MKIFYNKKFLFTDFHDFHDFRGCYVSVMAYRGLTLICYFNIRQVRVRKAKKRTKCHGNEKKKSRSVLTDFFRQWIINRKQTEGSSGTAPEIVYVNPHQCQPGMSVQMHTVIKFNLHLFCCISLETGTPSKKPRVTVIQYNFQICLFISSYHLLYYLTIYCSTFFEC